MLINYFCVCDLIPFCVPLDACASPDSTVQAILAEHNVDMNSTTAQLITVYTNVSTGYPL